MRRRRTAASGSGLECWPLCRRVRHRPLGSSGCRASLTCMCMCGCRTHWRAPPACAWSSRRARCTSRPRLAPPAAVRCPRPAATARQAARLLLWTHSRRARLMRAAEAGPAVELDQSPCSAELCTSQWSCPAARGSSVCSLARAHRACASFGCVAKCAARVTAACWCECGARHERVPCRRPAVDGLLQLSLLKAARRGRYGPGRCNADTWWR